MNNAEKKIEELLEDIDLQKKVAELKKNSAKWKALGLAGLGGMVGAGLDTYFNGGKNLDDFIKPLASWGIGGLVGGLASSATKKNNRKK